MKSQAEEEAEEEEEEKEEKEEEEKEEEEDAEAPIIEEKEDRRRQMETEVAGKEWAGGGRFKIRLDAPQLVRRRRGRRLATAVVMSLSMRPVS